MEGNASPARAANRGPSNVLLLNADNFRGRINTHLEILIRGVVRATVTAVRPPFIVSHASFAGGA